MCDEKAMFTLQRQVARLTATLMALTGGTAAAAMQPQFNYQQPMQGKLIMNGSTMPPQVPGACGGQQACPPSLVSPATEAAIKSGPRTANVAVTLGALAVGSSVAVTVASNSMERTLVISDLVSSIGSANLDNLRVTLLIGDNTTGREVDSFNGGRFARTNANDCTTACGFGACVGPIETLTIRFTNISAAALAAGSTANVDVRSIYRGEPGFSCGDCYQPGQQAMFPGSDQPVG